MTGCGCGAPYVILLRVSGAAYHGVLWKGESRFVISASLGSSARQLAAIIMAAVTEGKSGVKALLSRVVLWRVGLRWYVIALGLPTVLSLATAGLNYLLGASEFMQVGALTPVELVLFV
jgi:hypothetical protein